jgi:hypothetical protein
VSKDDKTSVQHEKIDTVSDQRFTNRDLIVYTTAHNIQQLTVMAADGLVVLQVEGTQNLVGIVSGSLHGYMRAACSEAMLSRSAVIDHEIEAT